MEISDVRRRVPRAARVLAVLAVLCVAPAVVWVASGSGTFIAAPLLLGSLATVVPLVTRDVDSFRMACRATGWGLIVVSAVGFLFGCFVLMPAGIVLVAAGSQSRPGSHRLPLLVGGLVSAATVGFAAWVLGPILIAPHFREPDAFLATVQEGSPLLGHLPPELVLNGSGLGHGARIVSMGEIAGVPGATLTVVFAPRTPASDLAVLRERIAGLPGVSDVRLCSPTAGNCR